MARATCAALLVLTCMSAACLTYTRADETEPQPAAGQHALGRALRQYVPTEITYSLENGINFPHIVKYKSTTTYTKKKAEEKKPAAEEEEEAEVEKGSVGDHAAKFANKPFKRKEPKHIEKSYTQKVTIDRKNPPPVKQDVIVKEKPSVTVKVTKEHNKAATVTATKDR